MIRLVYRTLNSYDLQHGEAELGALTEWRNPASPASMWGGGACGGKRRTKY